MISDSPTSFELNESCGFSALHFASYNGNPKIIELLVESGANIYSTNK